MSHNPPKELQALIDAEPDLVDRIFAYLLQEFPQLGGDLDRIDKAQMAVRAHFGGEGAYIPKQSPTERAQVATEVLRLFNGRNATELSRRLGISRRTVYRYLKQPGKE